MLSKEIAYQYADSVDRVLNRVVKNHPVSNSENRDAYAALIRTVRSSLDILETENNKHFPRCPACGKAR